LANILLEQKHADAVNHTTLMKKILGLRPSRAVAFAGMLLSLSAIPVLTGCVAVAAGAAAGAGAVAYVEGELQVTLSGTYDRVVGATRSALKELEFVKVSESKDALEGTFIYRTAADKKVTVTLNKIDDKSTKVGIRIGLIGDQDLSHVTLDKIKSHL
jgi:Protein of unknown function (DUF3568)